MAEHERKTGNKVTYRKISDATGISTNTLTQVANQQSSMIGLKTIDKLCQFFNCEPGDLLVRETVHKIQHRGGD